MSDLVRNPGMVYSCCGSNEKPFYVPDSFVLEQRNKTHLTKAFQKLFKSMVYTRYHKNGFPIICIILLIIFFKRQIYFIAAAYHSRLSLNPDKICLLNILPFSYYSSCFMSALSSRKFHMFHVSD